MKRKNTFFIIAGLLMVLVLLAGGFLWQREVERRWRWEAIPMPENLARVPEEWTAKTLAARLEKTKKIRDAQTFEIAAEQAGLKTIRPGGYALPEIAGPARLAEVFVKGPTHLKVTFPEGFTAHQMAKRLEENGFSAASQLRAIAYPAGQESSPSEGKWFPDTYWLALDSTAPQIAQRLESRYEEIAEELPNPFPLGYQGKRLNLEEVTVLASLIERETDVPEERPLIAGVLLNRLRIRMRLQCDASVQYALQKEAIARGDNTHQIVLRRDYKLPSPYNTYLHYGLPPGAICNPGLASLQAAAQPQETEYLFYVWSPKLKRHRFAKTFAEHRRNIALANAEK